MEKKVAVVTGASRGIGLAIVRGLCKRFVGEVFLTARDEGQGREAVKALRKEGLRPLFHQLDITDRASIERLRNSIRKYYEGIDILINNAAIAYKLKTKQPVVVQAMETLRVNYFGVLSTCEILIPVLKNGARIINISCSSGHLSNIPSKVLREQIKDPKLTIDELSKLMNGYIDDATAGKQLTKWGNSSYAVSKVGVTALTMVLQNMLKNREIKVNAVHPGFVATEMTSYQGYLTADEGAEAPLYLALDAPDGIRGQFIWYDKRIVNWYKEEDQNQLIKFLS